MPSFDSSQGKDSAAASSNSNAGGGHGSQEPGHSCNRNEEFLRQFRALRDAERSRYSQSTSGSSTGGTAGDSSGPTAGGRGGAQGGGRTPHRQQARGQSSSQTSSGGAGSQQGKDGPQLDERQVQRLLEEYYPWARQKVRPNDPRKEVMQVELDSKEWLDAPLNRAMRAEISEQMRRQGISEKNDPEGFHAELNARLAPLMRDAAWREAVKEKLQRRLGSVPTTESLEGSVKHNLYMNKMLTSSVVAFGAAVTSALACRFGDLMNGVMVVGVLGSTFLNLKLCEFWHHRREANEHQNLDILYNEAKKADTLEKKLAFTGALYHIISKHGLEKGWLGEVLPHYKEKFDWRGNERFQDLTSSLQKLQEAGRYVAEELIRTGNSLETELGVDRRFDQKMADFELDLKEIKKFWAERPDSALWAAKLGWAGGIVYTAVTFGEFLLANGY